MRLFIALDLDEQIRATISRFAEGIHDLAPYAGWVQPASLHVTLKFIGEKTPDAAATIEQALNSIQASPVTVSFAGYGFFPNRKAPRVFWLGVQFSAALTSLALAVDDAMVSLGAPKETHAFNPHLTLARARGASGSPQSAGDEWPNRCFQRLEKKLAALPTPEFGTMTAREFFLFQSQLSSGGSRYSKVATFGLR
jgi:2'-5' RNA ligase